MDFLCCVNPDGVFLQGVALIQSACPRLPRLAPHIPSTSLPATIPDLFHPGLFFFFNVICSSTDLKTLQDCVISGYPSPAEPTLAPQRGGTAWWGAGEKDGNLWSSGLARKECGEKVEKIEWSCSLESSFGSPNYGLLDEFLSCWSDRFQLGAVASGVCLHLWELHPRVS